MKTLATIAICLLPLSVNGASLQLKSRQIGAERTTVAVDAAGPRFTSGKSHLMLQFRHAVDDATVRELNLRGAFVVGTMPNFGVVVAVDDNFSTGQLDVAAVSRFNSEDKVSPLLNGRHSRNDKMFIAEFHADVAREDAERMAEAAGFTVHQNAALLQSHLLLSGPSSRLAGLAQWDEVAYIFPASDELINGDKLRGCAGAVISGGVAAQYSVAGSGWPKDANGQVVLSYVFGTMTSKLVASEARQEIQRAFAAWAKVSQIKFVPGQKATDPRTIFVEFVGGDHGDGLAFDGKGGTLAHTFYPAAPNAEPIAGDMHLDADEDWHIGANTDLYSVALHETGHALGLAHSDNPASVMYPYYHLGAKIGPDDIAGIQKLYGTATDESDPITVAPAEQPVLTLSIDPVHSTTYSTATASLTGTVSNATGDVKVTWQTDHNTSGTATGSSPWSIASIPLVTGVNVITITVTDDNDTDVQTIALTRSAPATGAADHTPPVLAFQGLSSTVIKTSSSTIDLNGTASDNVGVVKVTWQSVTATGTAVGTSTWAATSIPLLVGSNTITVRAYDAAGNSSFRSLLVTRK